MSFSCELLCRACMEPLSSNSMPLMNKKKKKKTSICNNFEDLTRLKVKENDQLPQQLCLGCVSELNKCFAFREKCVRTSSTLRAYLDLSEDDGDTSVDEQFNTEQKVASRTKENRKEEESKEGSYEEIEVTQDMVDAAKSTEMILEMEEEMNILNPTSTNLKIQTQDDNELVFIIQDVSGTSGSDNIIQSSTPEDDTKDENGKLSCFTCKMEFVRKKNFDNHIKRFHSGETEEIMPESKRLKLSLTRASSEADQLKKNLVANPDAKKCKTCGALYLNEKSLKLHEARGNACKQESYSCDVCGKIFTDQKLFTEHTESHPQQQEQEFKEPPDQHDPTKKFKCNVCLRSFKMVSTLKDHMRVHTGDKPFKCTICGRCFSQNTNLKQHLRRHTQIKPFKCEHEGCTATFVSKGELDSHIRIHTGHHPYSCSLCEASFTTSSSLLKHKRIHSGEKPYACEFCPMRFTALGTLRNHTRTHTGEKPHNCSFCDRAFTQKSDMVAHERTHTGDRPYVCKICFSSFLQSGTLKNHMKIHKKSEVNSDEEDVDGNKS